MSRNISPRIAIVGATGAVGREALAILLASGVEPDRIDLFGSARSAGRSIDLSGSRRIIRRCDPQTMNGSDYAILCTEAAISRRLAPSIAQGGAVVIDNSSAFRMDPHVPLIIPEVNGHLITRNPMPRLIANPNCSTIMMMVALEPLRRALGISSIVVTTYQAVSGAGTRAIDELRAETQRALDHAHPDPRVFPVSCAFNVFPHESAIDPNTGFNSEELKMIAESRRIWEEPTLPVLPTCVRVPVERAHSQSIVVSLSTPADVSTLRRLLADNASIVLADTSPSAATPRRVAGSDRVHIGRIREDPSGEGARFVLWICCDQLRKGAALNAVQIINLIEHAPSPPGELKATATSPAPAPPCFPRQGHRSA